MESAVGFVEISVGTRTETVTLLRELGRSSACTVHLADDVRGSHG